MAGQTERTDSSVIDTLVPGQVSLEIPYTNRSFSFVVVVLLKPFQVWVPFLT